MDWSEKWLTETERTMLALSQMDEDSYATDFALSLAASRALVGEKDEVIGETLRECKRLGDCYEHPAKLVAVLALTEDEMLERLEAQPDDCGVCGKQLAFVGATSCQACGSSDADES